MPEPFPIRLPHAAAPRLARLDHQRIERDLPTVQIQPTYHRHQGPPRSKTDSRQTTWLSANEPGRSSHIDCYGTRVLLGVTLRRPRPIDAPMCCQGASDV